MDHGSELSIPILEILKIEVFNILYKPGSTGKQSSSIFSYPGNIGKHIFSTSSYHGDIGKQMFSMFSYPGNIGNLNLDWGYVGMCLQPLFCCGTTPQGLFFPPKT